jgi:hypothetical protein
MLKYLRFWKSPIIPEALPLEGWCREGDYTWEDWKQEVRKEYPVWYFFKHTVMDFWYPKAYCIKRVYRKWASILWRRQFMVDCRSKANDYEYGYSDPCGLMLYANFALLKGFVEQESGLIAWDSDESYMAIKKEIDELYLWWTVGRPNNHNALADMYKDLKRCDLQDTAKIRDDLDKKDDEMLLRLIKMRGYLWS